MRKDAKPEEKRIVESAEPQEAFHDLSTLHRHCNKNTEYSVLMPHFWTFQGAAIMAGGTVHI